MGRRGSARRVRDGVEAPRVVLERGAALMFYEEAGVLDDEEAGGVSFGGSFGVGNALLEPECLGVNGNGGIGGGWDLFGPTEDVDDIDRKWDVFETGVGFFAKNLGFVGIDGNDFVADALEVGGNFVGGATRVGGKADDGDGFGVAKKIADGIGGLRRAFGNLQEHVDWMSGNGKRVNQGSREWLEASSGESLLQRMWRERKVGRQDARVEIPSAVLVGLPQDDKVLF